MPNDVQFVKRKENKVAFISGKPGKDWFDVIPTSV